MRFPRIKELRIEHNMTQMEVAERLNIQQSVYSRYERGVTAIRVRAAVKLAELYRCSLEYLSGRSDQR